MPNYRVSIRFSRLNDSALNVYAGQIITCMTGNPAFPDPLVPLAELASRQQAFGAAIVATEQGGRLATTIKNECRAALLNALRSLATYVQGLSRHDLAQLLSSGFSAASQNHAPSPLARPIILKILPERTTQLTLRLTPIANARSYQAQVRVGEGDWQEAGISSRARRMELKNLKPGTIYEVRVRAIGGSTGYSDWSAAISQMSL